MDAGEQADPMDSKSEYLQHLEDKLRSWDQQIAELREHAEAKDVQSELLRRVFDKRSRVDRDLEQLRQASRDQWERYMSSVAASTQDLQDALFRTTPRVEGKVQPGTTTPPPRRRDDEIEGGV